MSIEVATSARMRKGSLQSRHEISVSVSNAFRKELKVWEDVYKRDGYIRKGSWLSISVGLQSVVADALISTKEFQELSEREKLMIAFSIGQGVEEEYRKFQSRVKENQEDIAYLKKNLFESLKVPKEFLKENEE
tara:strand:+ start:467 stop:868 length:402 start_codon:yes stop_codon:yes gene_type:complete